MTRLDRAHLFSAELPPGSGPACAALARLDELTRAERGQAELSPGARAEAQALYAALPAHIAPLRQHDEESLADAAELRIRFVESVLLWMQFWQTSSAPLVDSLGTRSIVAFPIDLPPDPRAFGRIRQALSQSLKLRPGELVAAEARVKFLTSSLPLKLALAEAIAKRLEFQVGNRARYAELMKLFYGDLPLAPSDVDFVLTSTGIFFVLPIAGEQLDVADWLSRANGDREAIQGFLTRIARGNLTETWRFPAFGWFDAEALDTRLVAELSAATGARAELVRQALITMVTVLPKGELDQYLVHDAWGHTWQEVLNEFEWEYALLRAVSEPLSLADGPKFGGPETASFGSAFRSLDGYTALDEAGLLASAEADLRGRIQVGLSQVLSEVLADFVEAKFSRRYPELPLPTSSLLDSRSLKLDLTLQDLLRQARRCHRPYHGLWTRPAEQERWVRELVASGLPEAGALAAVQRAAALLQGRYAEVLRPGVALPGPDGSPGHSTLATRAALELALICHELESILVEAARALPAPVWMAPVFCPDLWAVSVSHLYEADRQNRFWCLDTLVRRSVRVACEDLGRALELWYPPSMATSGVLSPLFTNIPISADDAVIMAAALKDIAEVDGTHTEEQALIQSLVQELTDDLGDTLPSLPKITPKEIASKLIDPALRTVFMQSALLLAMADGKISAPERQRIREYARALDISEGAYAELERVIESWVRTGDVETLFS